MDLALTIRDALTSPENHDTKKTKKFRTQQIIYFSRSASTHHSVHKSGEYDIFNMFDNIFFSWDVC